MGKVTREETIRRYAKELQRVFTEQTHGDYTALGFCVEFAAALAAPVPDFTTHRGRVEFVRNDPSMQEFRRYDKRILAIKHLREQWRDPETGHSNISLPDARDAVYNAWGYRHEGMKGDNEWVSP